MQQVLPDSKLRIKNMAERVITVMENHPEIQAAVPVIGTVKLEIQVIVDEISIENENRYKAKNQSVGEMPEENKLPYIK